MASILFMRPELLAVHTHDAPIPLNPPLDYFPCMIISPYFFLLLLSFIHISLSFPLLIIDCKITVPAIPGIGELMLASFPKEMDIKEAISNSLWYILFLYLLLSSCIFFYFLFILFSFHLCFYLFVAHCYVGG